MISLHCNPISITLSVGYHFADCNPFTFSYTCAAFHRYCCRWGCHVRSQSLHQRSRYPE